MARRRQHEEHVNHERWLVSYADFITLLFAFFVVMFASSQADKGKAKQVSEAVQAALDALAGDERGRLPAGEDPHATQPRGGGPVCSLVDPPARPRRTIS